MELTEEDAGCSENVRTPPSTMLTLVKGLLPAQLDFTNSHSSFTHFCTRAFVVMLKRYAVIFRYKYTCKSKI